MKINLIVKIPLLAIILSIFHISPLKAHKLVQINDPIPTFTLYKENGEKITEKEFLGKVIVINFIFTRCAMPTLCPAATQKMIQLQKLTSDHGLNKEIHFITISFDPDFDSPPILKKYAQGFGADLSNYSFLTGDSSLINELMNQFGVYKINQNGTINHTARTLIFDKNGKMIYENSKKDWQPECLLKIIKKHLKK